MKLGNSSVQPGTSSSSQTPSPSASSNSCHRSRMRSQASQQAIVNGGCSIEVAGLRIRTTAQLVKSQDPTKVVCVRIVVASAREGATSHETRTVVERSVWIVVGVGGIRTSLLVRVANVIVIHILETIASTNADGVILVSIAVAITFRDVFTTAVVDGARPSTHTTRVEFCTRSVIECGIWVVVAGC